MKATVHFKETIKRYLDDLSQADDIFNQKYHSDKKNLDDCVTYILNQVKSSGCCGFADEEIYGMAVHYYDEEDINIGAAINAQVVVNHTIDLTEEEKERARQEAIRQYQSKCVEEYKQKSIRTTKAVVSNKEQQNNQEEEPVLTLF